MAAASRVRKVLLLGRKGIVLEQVQAALALDDIELFGGTSLDDVRRTFEEQGIDVVIIGAGLPLDARLQIVEHVFTVSKSTTVHMKDWDSGPQGMLPFVIGVLGSDP